MYCFKCGNKISNESNYCSNCGEKLIYLNNLELKFFQAKSNIKSLISQVSIGVKPKSKVEKYDLLYVKDKTLIYYGLFLLLCFFFLNFSITIFNIESTDLSTTINILSFVGRIALMIWVVGFTRTLNRNPLIWGLYTIFLPSMTLICLGLVKKKLYPRDFDDYTKNEMSIFFSRYSSDLYAHNQKELAEYFIEKSIKNNPKNVKALNIRGILKLEKGYFDQAVKDFSASIDFEKKNNGEAYYYRAMSKKSNNDRDGFIMDLYLAKDLGFQNAIEYFNQNKGLIEIRIIDYKDSSDQVDTLKIYNYMIYIANELLSNNRISDVEYKKFMLDINTTNATSAPLNWHKIVFKRIERRSSSEIISLIKDKFSGIITSEEYYIKEKLIILNYLSQTLKIDSHLDKNLYCNLSISQQDKVEMFLNSVVNSDVIFLHNNKIKILDFNSIQKNILGKENIKIIYQNYNAT